MRRQYIKAIIIILVLMLSVVAIKVIFPNKFNQEIALGDQICLFNQISEDGTEMKSIVAVYDPELKNKKEIIELDAIYTSIDQLSSTDDGDNNSVQFRVYSENNYQDVIFNLENGTIKKSDVIEKQYKGDENMKLNVFANGYFEILKPSSYMYVKDPNLYIEGKYYSLRDIAQFTNYQ